MYSDHTEQQRAYSQTYAGTRSDEDIDYIGNDVHEIVRDTPIRRLVKLARQSGVDFTGKRILIVGCGLGTDLFYLRRLVDAEFTCTDLSEENVRITKKHFPDIVAKVANSEALPFADDDFDYAIVCDSLHHMARPYLGIYEMLRTAKNGICIIEPHDCRLTRFATSVSLMQEYEDAGNYVLKFNRHDLKRLAACFRYRAFASSVFATDFGVFARLPASLRPLVFPFFRIGTWFLNAVVPGQGNAFVGIVLKNRQ